LLKLKEKQKVSTRKFTYDNTILKALDKLDEAYTKAIRWSLRHKTTTLLIGIVVLVISFMLMGKIGTDFMPQSDQGTLNVSIKCQTGQRSEVTEKTAQQVEKIIRDSYPEMIAINYSYGYSDESSMFSLFSKTGSNYINFRTRMVNKDERERSVFAIAKDLRKKLDTIPAIITYNINTSGGGGMFGGDNTVDVEIFGHDFQETNKLSQDISNKMKAVKGTADIQISREDDKPEIQITLDQKKLSQHGLSTAMASSFIRSQIYGITASKYKEDGEEYDIIVRFKEDDRHTITQIENFNITSPTTGKTIKLKELGQIEEIWTPPSIQREQRQRIVKVSIKPDGISLGQLANIVKEELKDISVPQGIFINVGGSYQDQQDSMSDLGLLMILIVVLVYIVMATQFESLKMPLIIMSSFLFAVPGIVLALLITNTTLSVVAALGAVLLVGIVVKNGIVLVDFINLMRERGYRLYDAIALACKSRLRPVLMTAITTILGMTPMAFSTGSGSETWKPMGIVVIGGLIFSTVVTMIIVPVLYATMTRSGGRDKLKTIRKQMHFMDEYKALEIK
jgi:HAE1 family hydrophobic/amphiphilic exporter-1